MQERHWKTIRGFTTTHDERGRGTSSSTTAPQARRRDGGQAVRFDVALATNNCGGSWLGAAPLIGTTPQNLSVGVTVTGINPPQACTGRVTLTAQGSATSTVVPVTFNVSASPLLNIGPSAIVFTAPVGGAAPVPRTLVLTSTDQITPINFTAGASTTSGGAWLSLAGNTVGQTPTNLSVIANPGSLNAGTYEGSVTITSPNLPAPQVIPVTLIVALISPLRM